MYGDVVSIGDAVIIAVIAIIIVFLALALLLCVLLTFKAIAKKNSAVPAVAGSNIAAKADDDELLVVLASAIRAYESR